MAAFGVAVMTAGPASAQIDCSGIDTGSPASVTPSSVLPGESITITGGGFRPDRVLGIGLFNPPVVLGSVASNFIGNYTATVQIPLGTPAGQNEITVFGEGQTGFCHQSLGLFSVKALPAPVTSVVTIFVPTPVPVAVTPIVVPTPVTPVPVVVQQPLARTGSSSSALVAAGLLAMALGFHLVRVGRRS